MAVYTENFNDIANGSLGDDANWTELVAEIRVAGTTDKYVHPYVNTQENHCAFDQSLDNDQYAEVEIKSMDFSELIGPAVRVSGTGAGDLNSYGIYWDDGHAYSWKNVDGEWTEFEFIEHSLEVGDVVKIKVEGTTLSAYINDVLWTDILNPPSGYLTDSDLSSGKAGIAGWDNGPLSQVDNFECADITGDISGSSDFELATSSILKGRGTLHSSSDLTLETVSVLKGTGTLHSSSDLSLSTSSVLKGIGTLHSLTEISLDTVGDILAYGVLSGLSDLDLATSSILKGRGNIHTSSDLDFSLSGNLINAINDYISGITSLDLSTSGVLKGRGRIQSAIDLILDNVAVLKGRGRIQGSSDLDFETVSILKGIGSILGSSDLSLSTISSITGIGCCVGLLDLELSTRGKLIDPISGSIWNLLFSKRPHIGIYVYN